MSIKDEFSQLCAQMAPLLDEAINPRREQGIRDNGFIVCLFEFGKEGGQLQFISNADPSDLAAALDELKARLPSAGHVVTINPEAPKD